MQWLIPSNPKFYDSSRKLHDNGYIQWSQKINVHVGDIIYIYESAVNKFVRFKCVVTRVDIPREQVENDNQYYVGDNHGTSEYAYEFHLQAELDKPITLSELETHGMGKRRVQSSWGDQNHDNKELFKYLAGQFDELKNNNLVPGNEYISENEQKGKFLDDGDALNGYFSNVTGFEGKTIKGGIKQNTSIKRRTVGLKGNSKRTGYFVISYKSNRWYSSGEFENGTSVFNLLGDSNREGSREKVRRGNYQLTVAIEEFYKNGIEKAFPIFLFEELANGVYKYIGLGMPFIEKNERVDNIVKNITIEHEGLKIENSIFSFTVDTQTVIDRNWLYDLRIGQGNNSDFMPDIWADFMLNNILTKIPKPTKQNELVEQESESNQLVYRQVRRGQERIRKELLAKRSGCQLCSINQDWMLVASHIVPWSANDYENISKARLDLDNLLLLCANHDRLFDRNYISFKQDGSIIIADEIPSSEYNNLHIDKNMQIQMNNEMEKYMQYHRVHVLERNDK